MRKTILLISVILMLALVGAIGCGSNGTPDSNYDVSDAEDTIRGFILALESSNYDKIANHFLTPDDFLPDKEGWESLFDDVIFVKHSNIETTLLLKSKTNTTVGVIYDVEVEVKGSETRNNVQQDIYELEKVDSEWLIVDIYGCNIWDTEMKNMRLAVTALMADAGVSELAQDYYEVNSYEDAQNVTAGDSPRRLTDYLDVFESLDLSYDINRNGGVSYSSGSTAISDWCQQTEPPPTPHTTDTMPLTLSLDTELKNVQLAMTVLMADNGIDTVTPQTTWVNDLSGDITSGDYASMKHYLDGAESMQAYYQWDSEGNVYQCLDTSCPDPF
ncbi:MAG: hypothetical protein HQ553_06850 [Chloroflexi bacterium]|nr:hypothetical protein [Chloroflexota bacterium]